MISFRLYDRDGTTLLGLLAEPTSWSFSAEFNEVGALSFEYPAAGINAASIAAMREIAIVDETGTEYSNARFVITGIDSDRTSSTGNLNITAKSILYRLDTALAYPDGGIASGEVNRYFDAVTAGSVLKTVIDDAKTRGALAGITYNFGNVNDSNGNPWPDTVTQEYPARTTILSILRGLSDLGLVEAQTQGRVIKATKPDGIGVDRTTGANPIILRYGHNVTEAPEQVSAEKLASVALVEGDEGLILERSNAGSVSTYGRLETSFTASGIDDTAVVQSVGDAYLDTVAGASRQLTVGLALTDGAPVPFKDFTVGDYVYTATATGLERVRVRQLTMSMSGGAVSASATLGDRIYEAEIRNARKLSAITSGSVSLGNGTLPTTSPVAVADTVAPSAPTSLSGTSSAYLAGSDPRAEVSLTWTAPTTNANGSALTDLRHYEVQSRTQAADAWEFAGTTNTTALKVSGLTVNQAYRFQVVAIDASGNRSAASNEFTITSANITSATGLTPSTPALSSRLGTISIVWNGLNSGGGAMPADFAYLEVHVSTASGFTPSTANRVARMTGPDTSILSDLAYNTTYYVKFMAYNKSGVASAASTQASASVTPLVNTDLIGNVVSSANIFNGAIDTAKLASGAVDASKILDGAVVYGKIAANAVSANEIAANSIVAGKIAANAVTAGTVAALAISAGNIQSNAITADKIEAGAITAAKIQANSITATQINSGYVYTGNLSAGQITAGSLSADRIAGGSITASSVIMTSGAYQLKVGLNTDFAYLQVNPNSNAGVTLNAVGFVSTATAGWITHMYPYYDNNRNCGVSTNRWSEVWSVDGSVNTSDEREKTDIADSALGLDFVNALRPVSYKWIDGPTDFVRDENGEVLLGEDGQPQSYITRPGIRTHYGLLAQQVKETMDALEIDDFAGFIQDDINDPDSRYSLRYHEFISPLIKAVQELSDRVEALEAL